MLSPRIEGPDRLRYARLFAYGPKMRAVRHQVEQVADTGVTVLVRGETGVGKDLVARALHGLSSRAHRPFLRVNCAALSNALLESELFGHERGAFTGADRTKPGKFEVADGGSLFLDEIGDLPPSLQPKLLHVLEDGTVTRVGGTHPVKVDVRIIAATNRNLSAATQRGDFREDLYYRLSVFEIVVPPLRERREEIPILARLFLRRQSGDAAAPVSLTPGHVDLLTTYAWPGNVRQLEHMMRRVVLLGDPEIVRREIEGGVDEAAVETAPSPAPAPTPRTTPLREIARRAALAAERLAITAALERTGWNRREAARLLRISYKALLYRMAKCGLSGKVLR